MSEKFCYNCRLYKPYYMKGYFHFDRLDLGRCAYTHTTIDKHNAACNRFECANYMRIDRKQAALAALIENLNSLAEIKQILEEDEEEALEAFLIERKCLKQKERVQAKRRISEKEKPT